MPATFTDRLAAVLLAGGILFATTAGAAPRGGTEAARSGPPVAATIIDGRVWTCSETVCRASDAVSAESQPATRECARAAAALGPFSAYSTGSRVLTAAELTRCNGRAPSPSALVAAR